MHACNVHWNLERDLVDELTVTEAYPAGSVHTVDLESMYIRRLAGSFSSRLLDLHTIGGTLSQIVPCSQTWQWSDHCVWDQEITNLVLLLVISLGNRSPSRLSLEIFNGSHIWVCTHVFTELEDENVVQSQCCQDLFFKLQTDDKVNWSSAQMKWLWTNKCCFRCGKQGHQRADCPGGWWFYTRRGPDSDVPTGCGIRTFKLMSPRGANDVLCGIDELPSLEYTEVLKTSRDLIFHYTGERLCNFRCGGSDYGFQVGPTPFPHSWGRTRECFWISVFIWLCRHLDLW
jgi:hypothetical protein